MNVAYSRDRLYKSIENRRQLFIDDDVIHAVHNISRRQHTPKKHPQNPLVKRDKPWEVAPYFRTSTFNVVRDPNDELFKCWYEDYYDYFGWDHSKEIQSNRVYYAESRDGLNWTKPGLGKFMIDGHNTNTVFSYPPYHMASCNSVLLDPKESDPERRFKSVYYHRSRNINVPKRTAAGGYIEAEMLDAQGNVVEEYSRQHVQRFTGDSVRHQVTWAGRNMVNEIAGTVKLNFYLCEAELFGFQFDS